MGREGLVGRIAGWPKFIATGETAPPEVIEAVRYFDGVNFTARARAPGLFTVGFVDTTCPPMTVYAAYNALRTPKQIFNDIKSGHTNTPALETKYGMHSTAAGARRRGGHEARIESGIRFLNRWLK